MKVGIIQSNYLPWRGYFDFIASCDLFIFHDDTQYTKQDWRNRNRIKTSQGTRWITVPVVAHPIDTRIDEIVVKGTAWLGEHMEMLKHSFAGAPYRNDALKLLTLPQALFCDMGWADARELGGLRLSHLNQHLIRQICAYLGITTPMVCSSTLGCTGRKTEKVMALVKAVGGDEYLSGPNAREYLDTDLLSRNGIATEWKEYDYRDYPQLNGEFEGAVTVLDLIANTGQEASAYIPGCWEQARKLLEA